MVPIVATNAPEFQFQWRLDVLRLTRRAANRADVEQAGAAADEQHPLGVARRAPAGFSVCRMPAPAFRVAHAIADGESFRAHVNVGGAVMAAAQP